MNGTGSSGIWKGGNKKALGDCRIAETGTSTSSNLWWLARCVVFLMIIGLLLFLLLS